MTLANIIEEQIQKEYRGEGKTHKDIAKAHNVSPSYIQALLSGERDWDKLKIGTISKMFPRATLNLNGDGNNTIIASNVKVNTQSINSGAAPGSAEQARARIIAALIPLDIPPESLQAVLRTINELDLN